MKRRVTLCSRVLCRGVYLQVYELLRRMAQLQAALDCRKRELKDTVARHEKELAAARATAGGNP